MNKAIVGVKKGMSQIFDDNGTIVPVTVIDMSDVYVVDIRDNKDKGAEITIGVGNKKKPTKAEEAKYKKLGKYPRNIFVLKVDTNEQYKDLKAGDKLSPAIFDTGDMTQVTSISKGKGFAGGMKRWGFSGAQRTHGQSDRERAVGSIGGGTDPGRVYKGKKMPGHMGAKIKTILNLKVASVDPDNDLLLVKGSVPGRKGTVVQVVESSLSNRFNKESKNSK